MASNKQVVRAFLEEVVSGQDETECEKPCYYEGRESYSWDAILSQVKIGSAFGQRYVKMLVAAARNERVSLQEFLRPVRPSI